MVFFFIYCLLIQKMSYISIFLKFFSGRSIVLIIVFEVLIQLSQCLFEFLNFKRIAINKNFQNQSLVNGKILWNRLNSIFSKCSNSFSKSTTFHGNFGIFHLKFITILPYICSKHQGYFELRFKDNFSNLHVTQTFLILK